MKASLDLMLDLAYKFLVLYIVDMYVNQVVTVSEVSCWEEKKKSL